MAKIKQIHLDKEYAVCVGLIQSIVAKKRLSGDHLVCYDNLAKIQLIASTLSLFAVFIALEVVI